MTAQSGDYGFSQISGTVANGQVAAGLDAAKIGGGLVSSQTFGYLANVSSDIQAQLGGKSQASHTHTAGGDVSGALSSLTVGALQGRTVSTSAPMDGQTLVWSTAASQWQPGAGGSGSGGAGMATQLGDLATAKASSTVLEIGQSCSAATPCNVRFGSRVYSFTGDAQATLVSGAGTAYIYITADGVLTVGHSMAVTCSSRCVAASGITSFPADAIPLYSWDAAGGAWGSSGADRRGWISRTTLLAGTGIVLVEAGGKSTIGIDSTVVPTYLSNSVSLDFPLTAAGACSADLTFSLTGAVVGDSVAPGWPSGLESGLIGSMRVNAADQIAVRLCAMGRDIDPVSALFRATIIRGF